MRLKTILIITIIKLSLIIKFKDLGYDPDVLTEDY